MWYAGIDWADAHHDVLVIDDASRQVGSLRVNHSPEGLQRLNAFLEHITGPEGRDQMACIVETSRGLLEASRLPAGRQVYPVHPKGGVLPLGPRQTRLMLICWPDMDEPSWPTCGACNRLARPVRNGRC